jgi:hypothetical protein
MGMHASIKDEAEQDGSKDKAEAKPVCNDATSKPTDDEDSRAAAATKAALATIEAIKVETPMMALASIEAPKLAPSLDMPMLDAPKLDLPKEEEIKPPHAASEAETAPDAPHAAAANESASEPQPRVSRFTLLAASLVLCAAFGAMIGALVAAGVTRPMPVASFAPTEKVGMEEINALKEQIVQARVDLAALKSSIDQGNRNASAQFSKIGDRVERIERGQAEPVAKLGKAIEAFEKRADHAKAAREATGSITPPQPIVGASKDASRAGIVDGWVLRDVDRGTAIIEGRMGLVEVDQGDVVPGVGRVEAIRKQDGRWVVVTPKGLIVPR